MREPSRFRLLGVGAALAVLFAFGAQALRADVVLTDKQHVRHQQIKIEKKIEHQARLRKAGRAVAPGMMGTLATGSIELTDGDGVEWFLNSDITFSTSSSASGAMSEASYTTSVMASTLGGGEVSSTLNDAFDGYNTLAISFTGATGPCETGNPNYRIFNKNGAATADPDSGGREWVFETQYESAGSQPGPGPGDIAMWRKVYVPDADAFARWLNFFRNDAAVPVAITISNGNNLGSDSNTRIFATSSGDLVASTADTWVGTFQNYSGTTSSDPRIAHILQGPGDVTVPLGGIHFEDGDDNPHWSYDVTLQPGQTICIMNFCVLKPSKAEAAAKAAEIVALPAAATQFMSDAEKAQVVNFGLGVQYWVSVKRTAGGTTDPSGAFQSAAGPLTVRAYPDAGWRFQGWTGDVSGTDNPFTFNLDRDTEVWANFINLPPAVQITSPAANAYLSGTVPVTAAATDDSGVAKVDFYVDSVLKATDTTAPYGFDWNTLAETPGPHTLKAVAADGPGLTGSHQITVNASNLTLTLTGSRQAEQAWTITREYGRLDIRVSNPGNLSVQKYVLYRKSGGGAYAAIKELTAAEVGTSLIYNDKYLTKGVSYAYKLTAVVGGAEVSVSNEVTI